MRIRAGSSLSRCAFDSGVLKGFAGSLSGARDGGLRLGRKMFSAKLIFLMGLCFKGFRELFSILFNNF